MPLCTVMMASLARELDDICRDARIDRVNQPNPNEILLQLHTTRGSDRLLLSANQQSARTVLTREARENPAKPPMFCMMLRKHLTNGRILSVKEQGCERCIELEILSNDELGVAANKRLICEMMGRNSNIILVGGDGRIIDCLKKVDADMSEKRQVLPGLYYRVPPAQDKIPLSEIDEENLRGLFASNPEKRIADTVLDHIAGIAPLIAREIAYRASGDVNAAGESRYIEKAIDETLAVKDLFLSRQGKPCLLTDKATGDAKDYSFTPIKQYESLYEIREMDSFSALLESYYSAKDAQNSLRTRTAELRRAVERVKERTTRKLENQRSELARTEDREKYREMADILGAFAYQVPRGAKSVSLPNLYSEDQSEITIPLSEKLTPQQNIKKYYKEYSKLKNAAVVLKEQIAEGEAELAYDDTVLDEISRAATNADIADIREELTAVGILRKRAENKKNNKKQPSIKPLLYVAPSGLAVLVGRNNVENDRLTLHEAGKSDLWFHVKTVPGSHVVLFTEGMQASDEDIEYCAALAAFHSSAKEERKVAVDYTVIRNVKKPSGSKPGMVIYDKYRTAFVDPKEGKRG